MVWILWCACVRSLDMRFHSFAGVSCYEVQKDSKIQSVLMLIFLFCTYGCSSTDNVSNDDTLAYPELDVERLEGEHTIVGEARFDLLGQRIAANGDANGNGKRDLLVSAFRSDAYAMGGGKIYLFSDIEDNMQSLSLDDASTLAGELYGGCAGASLTFLQDWNGDQKDEIVIGAPCVNRVYIVLGGMVDEHFSLEDAEYRLFGESVEDFFGWSVADVGDVNGDGRADLLIGADGSNSNGEGAGSTYLIWDALPNDPSISITDVAIEYRGNEQDMSGGAIAGVGDTDGDGLADFVIGAAGSVDNGEGAGKIYHMVGESGLSYSSIDLEDRANIILGAAGTELGTSIAQAGDIDGDGRSDIILGAPSRSQTAEMVGHAYVFGGATITSYQDTEKADITIEGLAINDHTGVSIASAVDFDHDEQLDVVVGAPDLYRRERTGTVLFFSGAELQEGGHFDWSAATYVWHGEQAGDLMGSQIVSIPHSLDGTSMFLAGAPGYDGAHRDQGAMYVLSFP